MSVVADVLVRDGTGRRRRLPTSARSGRGVLGRGGVRRRARARRPARAPARAGRRGSRDHRDRHARRGARRLHRRGGDAQHASPRSTTPPSSARCSRSGEHAGLCDVVSSGCITVGRAGEQLAPMGELLRRSACASSPTTAACVASAGVMRRALEYARVAARRGRRATRRGRDPRRRRRHARRRVVEPPRHPRPALGGGDGHRRPRHRALPRSPARRVHFLHCSAAGTVDLVRAAKARGLPVTAECAPHHFTLTDACVRELRSDVQGAPAAAHRGRRRRRSATASPTAPSTPSPPTTRRTPPESQGAARSRRRPPGMLGLETALAVTLTELVEPGVLSLADALALLSWRPAAIAGLADHGGPVAPGARRQPLRVRPCGHVGGRRGAAGEPGPQHAVRRPQAHRARCATPSSPASRSSSTARRPR